MLKNRSAGGNDTVLTCSEITVAPFMGQLVQKIPLGNSGTIQLSPLRVISRSGTHASPKYRGDTVVYDFEISQELIKYVRASSRRENSK